MYLLGRVKGGVLAAALAASVLAVAGAHPVSAGTNGQQITYEVWCTANWSRAEGYNQRTQWEIEWVSTPQAQSCNVPSDYGSRGWWWVGYTNFEGWVKFDGSRAYNECGSIDVEVPKQQDNDWFLVHVPS